MWYLCFFVLEAVVIVTGNVAVLVVFTRTPALRKRKYYPLVNLALADLLVGVISVPMYLSIIWLSNTKISTISKIYSVQDILLGTASVFGLTAVAIERAYAVYFPFRHRTLWKGVYMIGIAVIWIMAVFLAFSSKYFHGPYIFEIGILSFPIISSLTVIIIAYFLIWMKMSCMQSVQGHAIHERDNRLIVTLLIVTIISLTAWIPFQALIVYGKLCQHKCVSDQYVLVGTTKFLHYGNSLVNPIIYALRMPQFKKAVLNAIRCCKQDHLAVQVPNERPQHNRPNVIPLTTNYENRAFGNEDVQGPVVRDEKQLNDNTSTEQVSGKDDIQIHEDNGESTFL